MPSWEPIRERVQFDFGAAFDAVVELRTCASVVRLGLDGVATTRPLDTSWWGKRRANADHALLALLRDGADVASGLLFQAARIETAASAATAEQGRRDALLVRWEEEAAAERRMAQAIVLSPNAVPGALSINGVPSNAIVLTPVFAEGVA